MKGIAFYYKYNNYYTILAEWRLSMQETIDSGREDEMAKEGRICSKLNERKIEANRGHLKF